jgi:hypothetical protein
MFPAAHDDVGNIFYIDANFHAKRNITIYSEMSGTDSYSYPLSSGLVQETETVSISGFPQITNISY